ncbi:hypothetical protein AB6A40_003482 [Gnathostoma spinigerum]|uniref:Nucleoprotein TPR n=1 Tax=Gnathostoma spinigerum TaxID=75299 RepID=A0ABD6E9U9_9BILA
MIAELRSTNARLEGDLELQRQTQHLMSKQTEVDDKELSSSRTKLIKMEEEKKLLDERFQKSQVELLELRSQLAKYRTDINILNDQLSTSKTSEARLQQEVTVLRESGYNNEKMLSALTELKERLECKSDDQLTRLKDQLDIANEENEKMRKFVADITEQHSRISLELKLTSNKVETERDQALSAKKSAEDQLAWKQNEFKELESRYNALMEQLNAPETSGDLTAEGYKKETQQLRNKNNYLENQLKDLAEKQKATEEKLRICERELNSVSKLSNDMESAFNEQQSVADAAKQSFIAREQLLNSQLETSVKEVANLRKDVTERDQRITDLQFEKEQEKLNAQKSVAAVEKKLASVESARAAALARLNELSDEMEKIKSEATVQDEKRRNIEEILKGRDAELRKMEEKIENFVRESAETQARIDEARLSNSTEVANLRAEKARLENSLNEAQARIAEQAHKSELLEENLLKISERNAFLESSASGQEQSSVHGGSQSFGALYDVIKYLQKENREAVERALNAELQWKRLEAQQTGCEQRLTELKEKMTKLRAEAEMNTRAQAEKSEMMGRLRMLQNVQQENTSLKAQHEKLSASYDNLSKNVSEMQQKIASLEAEKATEKMKLQNSITDLQTSRKEIVVWKERHAEVLATLGKYGPERVVALTNEVEVLRRKNALISQELEAAKRALSKPNVAEQSLEEMKEKTKKLEEELEKVIKDKKESSRLFESAKAIARQYRQKYQELEGEKHKWEKEREELKKGREAGASTSEAPSADVLRLRQELLNARTEVERLEKHISSISKTRPSLLGDGNAESNSRVSSIVQAQMKQLEALNKQNLELKNQLEQVTVRFKDAETKLKELNQKQKEDSDSREELQSRLMSITSMAKTREAEIAKLRDEMKVRDGELVEAKGRICVLECSINKLSSNASVETGKKEQSVIVTPQSVADNENEPKKEQSVPLSQSSTQTSQMGGSPAPVQSGSKASVFGGSGIFGSQATNTSSLTSVASTSIFRSATQSQDNTSRFSFPAKSPLLRVSTSSEQSNAISQSTTSTGSASSTFAASENKAPAQQNVISGSGDEVHVISSSGVAPSAKSDALLPSFSFRIDTDNHNVVDTPRKRTIASVIYDQASSVETDSETVEPVKRPRESPIEQVSTSSRYTQAPRGIQLVAEKKNVAADDDGAEQEQQENVETTTNPEEEGGEDFLEGELDEDVRTADDSIAEILDDPEDRVRDRPGSEEGQAKTGDIHRELEEVGEDEEIMVDDEQEGEEFDEALEGGEEESDDEMDEDDVEDEDDYENDEEEESGEMEEHMFVGHHSGHREHLFQNAHRSIQRHHGRVGEEDDDDILIIEDDHERHSQSPADQSIDEADEGGSGHNVTTEEDVDTSMDDPTSADQESRDRSIMAGGRKVVNPNESSSEAGPSDHFELQKASVSKSASSMSQSIIEKKSSSDGEKTPTDSRKDNVAGVSSGEMELSQSYIPVAQSVEAVSASSDQLSRDSSPFVVNIDSDSRGASSTVTVRSQSDIGNSGGVHLQIAEEIKDSRVGGQRDTDLVEEEHSTPQTDDETGVAEPSTSERAITRRMSRSAGSFHDSVDEPSSSSVDPQGITPTSQETFENRSQIARRGRPQKARRGHRF